MLATKTSQLREPVATTAHGADTTTSADRLRLACAGPASYSLVQWAADRGLASPLIFHHVRFASA